MAPLTGLMKTLGRQEITEPLKRETSANIN
jgi:hypothetical protein